MYILLSKTFGYGKKIFLSLIDQVILENLFSTSNQCLQSSITFTSNNITVSGSQLANLYIRSSPRDNDKMKTSTEVPQRMTKSEIHEGFNCGPPKIPLCASIKLAEL